MNVPDRPWIIAALIVLAAVALAGCDGQKTEKSGSSQVVTAPSAAQMAASHALSTKQHATLASTEALVLLPTRKAWLDKAFMTADKRWYTASIEGDGYTIVIEGTTGAFKHPEIEQAYKDVPPATRQRPRIGRNELVVEAAFVEQGTAFSVEVECVQPDKNPLCTEDAFVHEVVAALRPWSPSKSTPIPAANPLRGGP